MFALSPQTLLEWFVGFDFIHSLLFSLLCDLPFARLCIQLAQDGESIEIDIDALDSATLRQLQQFVKDQLVKNRQPGDVDVDESESSDSSSSDEEEEKRPPPRPASGGLVSPPSSVSPSHPLAAVSTPSPILSSMGMRSPSVLSPVSPGAVSLGQSENLLLVFWFTFSFFFACSATILNSASVPSC